MTNQSTIDKLIKMRLSSMADAFRIQMNDSTMKEVPFEDHFGMLVDVEYTNRKKQPPEKADPSGRAGPARRQHRGHRLSIWLETEQSFDQPAVWQPVNTSQSTATFLLPTPPEVVKLIWRALLVWRHVNTITL